MILFMFILSNYCNLRVRRMLIFGARALLAAHYERKLFRDYSENAIITLIYFFGACSLPAPHYGSDYLFDYSENDIITPMDQQPRCLRNPRPVWRARKRARIYCVPCALSSDSAREDSENVITTLMNSPLDPYETMTSAHGQPGLEVSTLDPINYVYSTQPNPSMPINDSLNLREAVPPDAPFYAQKCTSILCSTPSVLSQSDPLPMSWCSHHTYDARHYGPTPLMRMDIGNSVLAECQYELTPSWDSPTVFCGPVLGTKVVHARQGRIVRRDNVALTLKCVGGVSPAFNLTLKEAHCRKTLRVCPSPRGIDPSRYAANGLYHWLCDIIIVLGGFPYALHGMCRDIDEGSSWDRTIDDDEAGLAMAVLRLRNPRPVRRARKRARIYRILCASSPDYARDDRIRLPLCL